MKILHYFLGFPPYRTGGLTKYVCDLMSYQIDSGNEVIALWPGKMNFLGNKKIKIKQRKNINLVINYEIINPLPVPLLDGINNIDEFVKKGDYKVFRNFLEKVKPDIIHIHTLMGLHKEFIKAAKDLKIKIVYTTHDYFGICPRVNLLKNDLPCDDDHNCKDCAYCNANALSINKIKIMQSKTYRKMKNSNIVKILRQKHKNKFEKNAKNPTEVNKIKTCDNDYIKLRDYYFDMINDFSEIYFNSSVSKDVFLKYMNLKNWKLVPITHKNVKDNKKIKKFGKTLNITYLGPTKSYKGFYLLLNALDEIYKDKNFVLNIYYQTPENREYLNKNDNYTFEELENIFKNTDLLVAPSIWYETFGFTVLEALSFGVPVLVTENVGAKDIVKDFGYVIKPNKDSLKEKIEYILSNRNDLVLKNKKIVEEFEIPKFDINYDGK